MKTISNPVETRHWQSHGLPKDDFSIESAIITFNSSQWPLMLDPQNQANAWIRNLEEANNLQITTETDETFLKILENSIIFGHPLLIEDVLEDLNPVLEPVLLKRVFKQGPFEYIRLNDSQVEYNNNFKLYMTTRLKNPNFLPEVSCRVKLVNFSITPNGLRDQLLGIVTKKEMPVLEGKYDDLVVQSINNKQTLQNIENKILEVFTKSKGDILEDESAIEILSSSKVIAKDINIKQDAINQTEIEIIKARKVISFDFSWGRYILTHKKCRMYLNQLRNFFY